MADAELVITPSMSEQELRLIMTKLESQIERSAKKSEKQWMESTSDGIFKGARSGLKKAGKLAKSAY